MEDTSRSLVDPTWESLRQDLSAFGGTCRSETKIPIHRGPHDS